MIDVQFITKCDCNNDLHCKNKPIRKLEFLIRYTMYHVFIGIYQDTIRHTDVNKLYCFKIIMLFLVVTRHKPKSTYFQG